VSLAGVYKYVVGGCPPANVKFPPALYSSESGYCSDGVSLYFSGFGSLVDLSNSSWSGGGFAGFGAGNYTDWQNNTYCYNYGTPSCSNSTNTYNNTYTYGYGVTGFSAFTWSGTTTFTVWTNGTNMPRADRWAVVLSLHCDVSSSASAYNLLAHWSATASSSMNLGTLGNGEKLSSVTIT
jgi:hypothetical protein